MAHHPARGGLRRCGKIAQLVIGKAREVAFKHAAYLGVALR